MGFWEIFFEEFTVRLLSLPGAYVFEWGGGFHYTLLCSTLTYWFIYSRSPDHHLRSASFEFWCYYFDYDASAGKFHKILNTHWCCLARLHSIQEPFFPFQHFQRFQHFWPFYHFNLSENELSFSLPLPISLWLCLCLWLAIYRTKCGGPSSQWDYQ